MTGEKAEPNQLKCHVTNLGAPNGHVSKPKIQFFRGANSLVISVVSKVPVIDAIKLPQTRSSVS